MQPSEWMGEEPMVEGTKTSRAYWDKIHEARVPRGLPSRLVVPTRNTLRLLAPHVSPGSRVLEIGFAPGQILLWLAAKRQAEVSGLDYSPHGVESAKRLFESCHVRADLRCEDVFKTSFSDGSFDFVYSLGVIEHFADPRDLLRRHLALARPGGVVLVAVPNYGGVYGHLQRHFDPRNLDIHNLKIMSNAALLELASGIDLRQKRSFRFGRSNLAFVGLHKKLPSQLARAVELTANLLGLVQPVDIPAVCPMLVLELRKH